MGALVEGSPDFPEAICAQCPEDGLSYAFLVPSQRTHGIPLNLSSLTRCGVSCSKDRILVVSASWELTHVGVCVLVCCVSHTHTDRQQKLSHPSSRWLSRCQWVYACLNCFTQPGISGLLRDFLVPRESG